MQSNPKEPLLPYLSFNDATAVKPLTVGQAQDIRVKYKDIDKKIKSDSLLEVYFLKIEYQASNFPLLEPGLNELISKLRVAKPTDNICDLLRKFLDEKESHSGPELKSQWRWIRCCLNETLNFEAQQYGQSKDMDGSTVFKNPDKATLEKINRENSRGTFFKESYEDYREIPANGSQHKPTGS